MSSNLHNRRQSNDSGPLASRSPGNGHGVGGEGSANRENTASSALPHACRFSDPSKGVISRGRAAVQKNKPRTIERSSVLNT